MSSKKHIEKWAVVTGGSSGLGLSIAKRLYKEGYNLILVSRSRSKLDAATQAVLASYPSAGDGAEGSCPRKVLTFPCDLSVPGMPEKLFEWTTSLGIVPEVLVNDAGMYIYEKILNINSETQNSLISLNVSALTTLCRLYGSIMAGSAKKSLRPHHILNIASYSVYMPIEGFSLYASSKAYVRTFSKCISKEMRRDGVYVTAVAPAGMDTGLMNLRPSIHRLASSLGFLVSTDRIARISLRVMRIKFIRYWIPMWFNVLFIPFLWMFQPLFKKVLGRK